MRFKIPDKIRVLSNILEIKFVEDVDADDEYGHWDSNRDRIVLNPVCTVAQQKVTFIHEYLHAVNRLFDNENGLKHIQIHTLAEIIADLIEQLEQEKDKS